MLHHHVLRRTSFLLLKELILCSLLPFLLPLRLHRTHTFHPPTYKTLLTSLTMLIQQLLKSLESFLTLINKQSQSPLQTAVIATVGLLLAAVLKYPNRAFLTTARPDLGKKAIKGTPLLGNMPEMIRTGDDPLGAMLKWFETYGDILSVTVPIRGRFIMVNHPIYLEHILKNNFDNYVKGSVFAEMLGDIMGNGIFVSDGDAWRFHRKTSVNVFTTKLFRQLVRGTFQETAQILCQVLQHSIAKEGSEDHKDLDRAVDLQQLFLRQTLDASGKAIFGIEFKTLLTPTTEKHEFGEAFDFLTANMDARIQNPFWHWTDRLTPGKTAKLAHALDVLEKYAGQAIAARQAEQDPAKTQEEEEKRAARPRDLLDHYINYTNPDDGSKLSHGALRDMFVGFMNAGRDTTAHTMAWMFYSILSQPRVLKNLRRELDAVLGPRYDPERLSYEVVMTELPYLKAVFHETLRLYPQTPRNARVAVADDVMPDGTHVCAGDLIIFSLWTMGRNRSVWGEDAAVFVPERWIAEDNNKNNNNTFENKPNGGNKSPFGKFRMENQFKFNSFSASPRLCLGQTFATLEAMVTACVVLQQFELALVPGRPVPMPKGSATLPMLHPLLVTVSYRS
ncbi:hypothetical protein MVEG_06882 [Podila verticillata NRRL 6337]|nr:hypothetical protein MVEG_06882 [Podila verticillata NRRL 6337]